jgi:Fic family protein
LYPAGIYRDIPEYAIVENKRYDFLVQEQIQTAIANLLNWYNEYEDIDAFFKIIIFYIIFCEIHPFYN